MGRVMRSNLRINILTWCPSRSARIARSRNPSPASAIRRTRMNDGTPGLFDDFHAKTSYRRYEQEWEIMAFGKIQPKTYQATRLQKEPPEARSSSRWP